MKRSKSQMETKREIKKTNMYLTSIWSILTH